MVVTLRKFYITTLVRVNKDFLFSDVGKREKDLPFLRKSLIIHKKRNISYRFKAKVFRKSTDCIRICQGDVLSLTGPWPCVVSLSGDGKK
jgi:hypothetical protein